MRRQQQTTTGLIFAVCGPYRFVEASGRHFAIPGGKYATEHELEIWCKKQGYKPPRYQEDRR